ncbi:MAG: site-specific integrase [Anaerolineales bacterium]|nr:site-specific integrase [Anaerolineales bacterium]
MKNEIAQFKRYLAQRYPGRSTAKHYTSDLMILHQFFGDIIPKEITVKMIDQFVQSQSEQGLKPATINRRLSSISSFFEYLIAESEDNHWRNPIRWRRHSIRPGQHLPRDVTDATAETLLAVIEDRRDRAMVMLMLGAGLRIGEVVELKLSNLDITGTSDLSRLRVQGKGDKERVVWLTQEILHHVRR